MLIIGMTCYNAEKYISRAIQSVQKQTEQNWKCYIINDLSTDNSIEIINNTIKNDDRFILINNKTKHYQTGNYHQICNHKDVNEDDIFVELDGDDFFSDDNVLTRVLTYYTDLNVWLTFGSFKYLVSEGVYKDGFACSPIGGIHQQRITNSFTTSHLRTWRVSLFRHLTMVDICENDGITYIPVSGDLYFFQCMLEMCGEEHSKFISDINYVYNANDLSEHNVDISKVFHYTNMAKTRTPKKQLESL